jgi:hypothetical protein
MIALVLALVTLLPMTALAEPIQDSSAPAASSDRSRADEGPGEDPEGARGLGADVQEHYRGRTV